MVKSFVSVLLTLCIIGFFALGLIQGPVVTAHQLETGSITGYVVDCFGDPYTSGEIRLMELNKVNGKPLASINLQTDGSFQFNDLKSGAYTAVFYFLGRFSDVRDVSVPAHRMTILNFMVYPEVDEAPKPLSTLSASVIGRDGKPLSKALVIVTSPYDGRIINQEYTDEKGYAL